jgi:hypothetical protein
MTVAKRKGTKRGGVLVGFGGKWLNCWIVKLLDGWIVKLIIENFLVCCAGSRIPPEADTASLE